ncbi:MAG: tryptophan synthase subunit alpha [Fulvivirga sp.]
MNRIDKLFKEKEGRILSIYFTAGFPELKDTLGIAEKLENAGADMIEIGIPFSDPIADGPTIQESNKKALDNGMTINLLFKQLEKLRETVSIPVILMGYINPVLQYGFEQFCRKCEACGIDGLILPDLPIDVYASDYKEICENHGLHNVFLITPQTSQGRIKQIDNETHGFIYMVSSASTTGAQDSFGETQTTYFKRIKQMKLSNPTLVGFGISNNQTFMSACENSNGAIIGSAFIKLLASSKDLTKDINSFIKEIKA